MAASPSDRSAPTPSAPDSAPAKDDASQASTRDAAKRRPREIGGPIGPEPTRYGDWERNGKVSDF